MLSFSLNAISPIDGRYSDKTAVLSNYFSEKSLIKNRIIVEIEYFISLCEIPLPQLKSFNKSNFKKLREIYENFSEKDAISIKEIENYLPREQYEFHPPGYKSLLRGQLQ